MDLATDMQTYCKNREWYEDVPGSGITSNGTCDDIPLLNLYNPYRQFVLGRMLSLRDKNYYNCNNRFRTLEVSNWSVYLNDLFIHCTYVDRDNYDFPVRIITDFTTDDYTPEINRYVKGQRQLVRRDNKLFDEYGVTPNSHDIDSLSPYYGAIDNILMNREICQLYRQGIKLWQCMNPGLTYLFFVSYKLNYPDYDVTIHDGKCTLVEDGTDYVFQDVTANHVCEERRPKPQPLARGRPKPPQPPQPPSAAQGLLGWFVN
jgi:hypothetical protein